MLNYGMLKEYCLGHVNGSVVSASRFKVYDQ